MRRGSLDVDSELVALSLCPSKEFTKAVAFGDDIDGVESIVRLMIPDTLDVPDHGVFDRKSVLFLLSIVLIRVASERKDGRRPSRRSGCVAQRGVETR